MKRTWHWHSAAVSQERLKIGITKKEREEYKELLKILGLGLENRLTSKVGLLSGGQRQALTLLMATLKKPKLLLLDEHTAALDPKTAAKVLETTDMIVNRDHLTTIMITHNMKDAIAHGNRLIMLYGRQDHPGHQRRGEEETHRRRSAASDSKRPAAKNSPMTEHCSANISFRK